MCVLAACAPSSDPAADSVGRLRAASASPTPEVQQAPPVRRAPTYEFVAPVEAKWSKAPTRARAGVVNISLTSEGNHNLALVGPRIPEPLIWGDLAGEPEDDLTYSVDLVPGVYTFYCAVPGHRAAGMAGKLRVVARATASPTATPRPTAS